MEKYAKKIFFLSVNTFSEGNSKERGVSFLTILSSQQIMRYKFLLGKLFFK